MIKKLYKELDRLNRMQLSAMMNGNYVYMFYLRQQMVELCENVLSSQDENSDDSIMWAVYDIADYFCITGDLEDYMTVLWEEVNS